MFSVVAQYAEWDAPETVLVHIPNDGGELTVPSLHAPSALFESAWSPDEAAAEHRAFTSQISTLSGATVRTLRDVLLEGTIDERGAPREGVDIESLRELALQSVLVETTDGVDNAAAQTYVKNSIAKYHPYRLFDLVMQRPVVTVSKTDTNTGFSATYGLRPLMNMCYMRDQSITTAKGRVLMRMASSQRQAESVVLEAVMKKLGEPPVGRVYAPETMEGGDFIPAGEYALQGVGLRTTQGALEQLLEQDAYGVPVVVAVKDHWRNQEEMHLDTYFNVINGSTAVLVESRFRATPGDPMYTTADVYMRNDVTRKYEKRQSDVSFVDFLRSIGFLNIIPVSKADQLVYGCNFATVGPHDIIIVKRDGGVSQEYREALAKAGVRTHEAEMSMLTKGYGAAHCTTQFSRKSTRGSGSASPSPPSPAKNLASL